MEKFFRIKPRHIKGLRALVEQPTYKKAAQVSGVSERTLYRWVHENPDLRQELKFMLQEAFSHGLLELEGATSVAVRSLREVMDGYSSTPREKSQAARAILQSAIKIAQIRVEEAKVQRDSA